MYEYMIGVGAMKAGTTLMYRQLLEHPQIRRGVRKSVDYFNITQAPSKAQYDALFAPGEGPKMDISPFYMYYAPSIERIAATLDPKRTAVVVLLRDPVERAFSHYRMRKSQNMEDQPFEATFELEASRTARSYHDLQLFSYFTRGLYAQQLDRLYALFPKENIRIYLFEEFIGHQQQWLDDLCGFLGIRRVPVQDMHENKTVVNVKSRALARLVEKIARLVPKSMKRRWMGKLRRKVTAANERKDVKETIDPAFARRLTEYYREEVLRLRDEYGVDISKWKHFANL